MFKPNFVFAILLAFISSHTAHCIARIYYVAIEEIEWDYAPSGKKAKEGVMLDDDEDASVFTSSGRTRIGRVYKKAVFREYEDTTFSTRSPREEHWGIIGPPLRAEVGDLMIVHVKNNAFREYSMHPHGVFYNKTDEGAVYYDRVAAVNKMGEKIRPGDMFIYQWNVTESFGPTKDDPDCITWAYHSHVQSDKDTNSGLVGPILICRSGSLGEGGRRLDVDREMFLLFTVFDENESWYLNENIQAYASEPASVVIDDEDFQESNKMHGINGKMYGNLGGLFICQGDCVGLHLFGVGTEVDLHTVHFQGQTIISQGHRQDTLNIFPGVFTTAIMAADHAGKFKLLCEINDHLSAGMSSILIVDKCGRDQKNYDFTGNVRNYYIGIVEKDWNYGPLGMDTKGHSLLSNSSDSETFFKRGPERIGGVYKKAIFYEYETSELLAKKEKPSSFGILGPLIAAEIGETVHVTLKNFANKQAYNIEPHGVFFTDVTSLGPGQIHTYKWTIPESVSPTDVDGDCLFYLYFSSVHPAKDTNSGLVGPLLVCRRGTLARNLRRKSQYLLFTVFDENLSHYLDENIQRFTLNPELVDKDNGDFQESNLMHAINGLMYGSLEVNFCQYSETDIHVIGLGTEVDMHSMYLGGLLFKYRNEWTNVLSILPHTTASTTVKPNTLGAEELSCAVFDHLLGGMYTNYTVIDCGIQSEQETYVSDGITRRYYVGAVDEIWDYMPWKEENLDHDLSAFTEQKNRSSIGTKYWKAIFHEYTDDTFTTRKTKPLHLGYLGPVLKGEEGDIIKVIFRNMARRRYNMVPWGLYPEHFHENGVAAPSTGETVTYVWEIPKLAVPSENQPPCNGHAYVSTVDIVPDMYTGMIGPMLICRKGGLSSDGLMDKADAEFFLSFFVTDENNGHYIDENIRQFTGADPETFDKEDEQFVESNLMHSINGRLNHLEGLKMFEGDRVMWHLLGFGNEVDIHTVHFHAHAYMHVSDVMQHGDVFTLFPGKMGTVEMIVDDVGSWLLHCHVNDHAVTGMSTTYTVLPKNDKNVRQLPCSGYSRWGRINKIELYCSFEDPVSLQTFVQDARNSIHVCPTIIRNEHITSCKEALTVPTSSIYYLNVSTDFNMEANDFRDLISLFTGLRYVYANHIGLRFLSPTTFVNAKLLIRIYLRKNMIRNIPNGLFNGLNKLRFVDFQNNDLGGLDFLSDIPAGSKGKLNLRRNPRLGKMQRVYTSMGNKWS
ncbi:hephaestin-like protein [Styela clava]